MSVAKYLVPAALFFALASSASARDAVQTADFTLGPGGKITIWTDSDSSTPGCVDTSTGECDRYSMKIPVVFNNSGDFTADLKASPDVSLRIGATGELCPHGGTVFTTDFPGSSFKLTKSKTSESAKFSGTTLAVSDDNGRVTVPISITLKGSLKTGIGSLTAKGLGQGLSALNGATVDVLLAVQEVTEEGDMDDSCTTVPVTFKTTP